MGFGLSAKVEVPKAPAVPAVPKAPDLAGAVAGAVAGAAGAAAGAAASVAGAVAGAAAGVTAAAGGALAAAAKAGGSLTGVAGALAEVAVSFEGPSVDLAMEPHLVLDANASYGDTKFEKGPVWIRVDLKPEKAKASGDTLRLYTARGEYDVTKRIGDFDEEQGAMVDIRFDDAPMDKEFSLEVNPGTKSAHFIFKHVPYGDLRATKGRS